MKKNIFTILGLVAMMSAVSCIAEKDQLLESENNKGVKLTFNGATTPNTKISIGEKDGNVYPLHWEAGDNIAIWSKNVMAEGEGFLGNQAELYSGDAGKTSGVFQANDAVAAPVEQDILILYPAATMAYNAETKVVSKTVQNVQEQVKANSSIHIGNNVFSYAETHLSQGQDKDVTFTLDQRTAFVKLSLTTSEFSNLNLISAKLYAPGKILSGDVEMNIETKNLKVTRTFDNVGAKLRRPTAFSSQQDLYFTALPCDLTGADVYVIVTMGNDQKTVNIPIKIKGGELKASALSIIKVEGISTTSNTFDWYEPVETRYVAAYGEGWSYGPANCFVAYFDGDAVEFDVKARGNFAKCSKPAYLLVHNACEMNISNKSNLEINGQNGWDGEKYIKIPVSGPDYKVSVKALAAGSYNAYSSKVKLFDQNDECIWSFNIWGNKEQLVDQTYANGIMLDRNIGSDNSKMGEYIAGSYFQWGRPFTNGWSASGGLFDKAMSNVTDLSISANKPEVFFYTNGVEPSSAGDWYLGAHTGARTERLDDLWGNANLGAAGLNPEKGTKSIYDPCPKGYMVPTPKILEEIAKTATFRDVEGGYRFMDVKLSDNSNAVWPFSGCKWGNSAGNCDNNKGDICACWSNSSYASYEENNAAVYMMFYRTKDAKFKDSATRGHGYPVRCMKDTENR